MPRNLVCVLLPLLCCLAASSTTSSPTTPSNPLAQRAILGPVCDISTGWPMAYDCTHAFYELNEFLTGNDEGPFIYGELGSSPSHGQNRHELVTPLSFVAGYCAITIFNLPNTAMLEHESNDTIKQTAASIITTCIETGGLGTGGYYRNLGLLGNLALWVYSQWLPSGDFGTLSPIMNPTQRQIHYIWRSQTTPNTLGTLIAGPEKPLQCFAKGRLDPQNITPDKYIPSVLNSAISSDGGGVEDKQRNGYCDVGGKGEETCCKGYKCVAMMVGEGVRDVLLFGARKVGEVGVCLFDQGLFDQAVGGS